MAKDLKINYNKINIQPFLDSFLSAISEETKRDTFKRLIGNVITRLRMNILYLKVIKKTI